MSSHREHLTARQNELLALHFATEIVDKKGIFEAFQKTLLKIIGQYRKKGLCYGCIIEILQKEINDVSIQLFNNQHKQLRLIIGELLDDGRKKDRI